MTDIEVFLTAQEARKPYGFSESGWREAWRKGRVPAPVQIGGKFLWPRSRLDAFQKDMLDQATAREEAARHANSPAARHAAELAASPAAEQARQLGNSPGGRQAARPRRSA